MKRTTVNSVSCHFRPRRSSLRVFALCLVILTVTGCVGGSDHKEIDNQSIGVESLVRSPLAESVCDALQFLPSEFESFAFARPSPQLKERPLNHTVDFFSLNIFLDKTAAKEVLTAKPLFTIQTASNFVSPKGLGFSTFDGVVLTRFESSVASIIASMVKRMSLEQVAQAPFTSFVLPIRKGAPTSGPYFVLLDDKTLCVATHRKLFEPIGKSGGLSETGLRKMVESVGGKLDFSGVFLALRLNQAPLQDRFSLPNTKLADLSKARDYQFSISEALMTLPDHGTKFHLWARSTIPEFAIQHYQEHVIGAKGELYEDRAKEYEKWNIQIAGDLIDMEGEFPSVDAKDMFGLLTFFGFGLAL